MFGGELVDRLVAVIRATNGSLLRLVYQIRVLALYLEPVTVGRVLKKLSQRSDIQTEGPSKMSSRSLRVRAAQQLC